MTALRRVPLRWRVTATFTLAAALVLGVLGVFLHLRLLHQLDESIESALRQRLRDVSSLVRNAPDDSLEGIGADRGRGGPPADVTQVLSADGDVLASEGAPERPLLDQRDLGNGAIVRRAGRERGALALLAGRVGDRFVIVGTSLRQRDEAISELDRLLLLGLPTALLLAALAGAWASRTALAPVDRMRRQADAIEVTSLDERLPVPLPEDELRRLARTLNVMLDRLQAGYEHERAFVDDAAHELRTPLTTLRAELELATSRPRSPAELNATVRSAQTQTERLVALANDLLVLARSAHGELPMRREQLAVEQLLAEAASRAKLMPRGARVTAARVDAETVLADRARLEQALDNLVENALQHGEGEVTLGASSDEEGVRFTVDDEGGPIDAELAQRAFDRFTRGDSARTGTGTGLGLSIVAAVASAHGGAAGLEPSPSGGTRAWLRLPAGAV